MTLFWNPIVYFDLSGTRLKRKGADWFREILRWSPERMKALAVARRPCGRYFISRRYFTAWPPPAG